MKNYCDYCHQADDYVPLELPATLMPRQTFVCPLCRRKVILINIASAMAIVQKSRQTIYEWMRISRISYVEEAGGQRMILYSSLFFPPRHREEDDGESLNEASTNIPRQPAPKTGKTR
jgi:hypothetical protein